MYLPWGAEGGVTMSRTREARQGCVGQKRALGGQILSAIVLLAFLNGVAQVSAITIDNTIGLPKTTTVPPSTEYYV